MGDFAFGFAPQMELHSGNKVFGKTNVNLDTANGLCGATTARFDFTVVHLDTIHSR